MRSGGVAWSLIGLSTAALGLAIAWPGPVDRAMPGAGEKLLALRSHLPTPVAEALPPYASEPKTPRAQAGASGAPAAQPPGRRGGRGGNRPPAVVALATATRGPMPVIVNAVGTVQPVATVALKSRVDAQIQQIMAPDGAVVAKGQLLARLDSRQIEAQIKQAEATLARDSAALEQATRDVARFEELVSRNTGTKVNLDNARTQVLATKAAVMGDKAQIENLKVQLSYYAIHAPIDGRIGAFNVKAGNIIRAGDNTQTGTLATIIQTKPIYVAFSVPQRFLPDLRTAIGKIDATVEALPQGADTAEKGKVAFVDNAIDPATGTVTVRAVFDNDNELLWPGQLCNLRITLRTDADVVSIPRDATQAGQNGSFVYVIENGLARVRPISVIRTQDGRDIVGSGLKGGESVVVEGALALVNGAKVEPRASAAKRGS